MDPMDSHIGVSGILQDACFPTSAELRGARVIHFPPRPPLQAVAQPDSGTAKTRCTSGSRCSGPSPTPAKSATWKSIG